MELTQEEVSFLISRTRLSRTAYVGSTFYSRDNHIADSLIDKGIFKVISLDDYGESPAYVELTSFGETILDICEKRAFGIPL